MEMINAAKDEEIVIRIDRDKLLKEAALVSSHSRAIIQSMSVLEWLGSDMEYMTTQDNVRCIIHEMDGDDQVESDIKAQVICIPRSKYYKAHVIIASMYPFQKCYDMKEHKIVCNYTMFKVYTIR